VQRLTFWDIERDLEVGPLSFDLNAKFDDVISAMKHGRDGDCWFFLESEKPEPLFEPGLSIITIPITRRRFTFKFKPL
jgi:hypothetical protein